MKNLMLMTALAVGTLAMTGCKAKTADTDSATTETTKAVEKAAKTTKVTGYSKADFMKSCEISMTKAQCGCFVDFYKSIGLKVTELGDQAKVQAAVTKMKPEQAMEMQKCMQ